MNRATSLLIAITMVIANGIVGAHAGQGDRGLRVSLTTLPVRYHANEPVALTIDVRDHANRPARDLPLVHERPIHLIIVPADLSWLAHLHPVRTAAGRYGTSYTFPHGGKYRVYADLQTPDGTPMVVPFTLDVPGDTVEAAALDPGSSRGGPVTVDGVRAERTSPHVITAGDPVELGFSLTDARSGGPIDDLEPYLGAIAHVIIISADGKEFLHAHTMKRGGRSEGGDHHGHGMHGAQEPAVSSGATMLTVHSTFPRVGQYRIWMQTQRKGQVITLPFAVAVSK